MLRYALLFLLIAIIAGVFGFGGIAEEAVWIARILCFLFVVLCLGAILLGRKGPPPV